MSGEVIETYDAVAPIYDEFTEINDYEMWFDALLAEGERHGLRRGRALDVGCGTGRAFGPLLRRGWLVQGCDLSPGMLEQARRKVDASVRLDNADIRELPRFGEFDLVLALNDVINYLTADGDLERAFGRVRANLAPSGLFVFDSNTLSLFEEYFATGYAEGMSHGRWQWSGLTDRVQPGGIYEARLAGDGVETHIHRERHHPIADVKAALGAAGLKCLAVLGQQEKGDRIALLDPPDESRDLKLIYFVALS
ncbi:MAG TPA: methyltransferase domain-containing protein [Solirubrobacterales bacterium]|nr:methyltransferase domain-containing protein [Solirubrobacterales bacterium]